ncbi:MAG TPA: NADP-dependent oxidoreductase [Casimicrobiaceae bacterium]|nr:NADP-dependent oxidoreductase [Casimicrobiaceae bacterium]
MRAVRYEQFGSADRLEVVDIAEPIPAAGQIKVRVRAASLNPLDWKIRAGHVRFIPLFARPPRGTGCDFAGEIVAVGGGPGDRFVGERVFGSLSPFPRDGACAEYAVIAANTVVPIPDSLDFEQASALPIAAGTALQVIVDDANVAAGQRVLMTGGAGGVGHFAVQLAKHRGAHVVATASAANGDFVRSLGADEVVDYRTTDIAKRDDPFDLVFDIADAIPADHVWRLLKRGGVYVGVSGNAISAVRTTALTVLAPLARVRARSFMLKPGAPVWRRLGKLAADRVLVAHIAERVPLERVADAQRRMETGHGRGKIVVLPTADDQGLR